MPIDVGKTIGFYRVIECLGEGGMSTVYKAHHTVLDRYVALKVLHPIFLEDPGFLRRFRREARVIASLDHPNIIPIYEFAQHEGLPYLVMKFIEGETLKSRLTRGPISRERACEIIEATGRALAYAHECGVLHRDVKPSNILMGEDGAIYLFDFGLARILEAGESTLSREMMVGTAYYISPEQARSAPDLDERADIYSLGIVLYELVVGRVPFGALDPLSIIHDHLYTAPPRPSSQAPNISEKLERVLLKALSKEREERFASVDSMLTALREAMAESDIVEDVGEQEYGATVFIPPLSETATVPSDKRSLSTETEVGDMFPARDGVMLVSTHGVKFPLIGERLLLGREDPEHRISPDIDLTVAEPLDLESSERRRSVHREQAWIYWSDQGWCVEVLPGKEDRAWFEGEPMKPGQAYPLRAGDRIKFGAVELVVRY